MSAFARRHGRGKSTATKWKAAGLLEFAPDGRVDVAASEANLRAAGRIDGPAEDQAPHPAGDGQPADPDPAVATDPVLSSLSQRLAAGDMLSITEAEQVKQNYLARLRQLEYAHKAEQVVDVEAVADVVAKQLGNVRQKLLALPHSAAPLAAHQDATAVLEVLNDKVRQVLEELSSGGEQEGGEEVAQEALRRGR